MNRPNATRSLAWTALVAAMMTGSAWAQNPLARSSGPAPVGSAAPDPFSDTFANQELSLQLTGGPSLYTGEVRIGGQSYPASVQRQEMELSGTFQVGAEAYEFRARLDGDQLSVESGGEEYLLARSGTEVGQEEAAPAGMEVRPGEQQAGMEIRPGIPYQAGVRVLDRAAGVSFQLPDEWLGQRPAGTEEFLIGSNSRAGIGVVVTPAAVTLEQARAFFAEAKDLGDGVVLQADGSVQVTDNRLSVRYSHPQFIGVAGGLVAPSGNGIGVLLAGPRENAGYYQTVVDALLDTAQFAVPTVATGQAAGTPVAPVGSFEREWIDFLAGMMLKRLESYSSTGGSVSGGYSIERTIHLCRNGSFQSSDSSMVSAGNAGISGYDSSRGSASGSWSIQASESNSATLLLHVGGGQVVQHALTWDPETKRTYLNGERVFRVPSDACP